ncbi:MAG: T9SS type A sorting domain-containing protein [Ignavibacteriae bacterium]|nr:T9SS type A sorting domain-containing protein [Ignavibacteriota bacterium]
MKYTICFLTIMFTLECSIVFGQSPTVKVQHHENAVEISENDQELEEDNMPDSFITGVNFPMQGRILIAAPSVTLSSIDTEESVGEETQSLSETPTVFALYENYPNPFNPSTIIRFDLPEPSVVKLNVYNLLGQEVAILLNSENFEAGSHQINFDAGTLSSGVYYYRLTAETIDGNDESQTQTFTSLHKMALVR